MDKLSAITGATGYVGRFVVAELARSGSRIRALTRRGSDRGGFDMPIEWVEGDLRDSAALTRLVEGASSVVHLAYEHVPGKYRGGEGDDLPGWLVANLVGSINLIEQAKMAGVGRFVFLSSRAVFGRTLPGRELDESHPTTPDTHYGAYKAAVEAFLSSYASAGMRTCSIRATGVYGLTYPLERTKWWPLIHAIVHDQPVNGAGGGTEVHGADVARVICAALENDDAPPAEIIHLSDLYVSQREVVRLAREIAGKPGSLPAEPPEPPRNMLVCKRIAELNITLGGQSLLKKTVDELIKRASYEGG